MEVILQNNDSFFNGPSSASFSFTFVFSNKHHNFLQQLYGKNMPSIFEPTTFICESHTITTRPWLTPFNAPRSLCQVM